MTLGLPEHAALFALDHLLPPADEEVDWVAAAALYASHDLQRASHYMDQVMRTQSVAGATLAGFGSPGVSQYGGPPNPYGTALLFLHFDPTQAVPSWVVDFYRRRRDTRGSGWLAGRVYDQLTGKVPDVFDHSVLGPIPEDYFAFRGLYNNSVPTTAVEARRAVVKDFVRIANLEGLRWFELAWLVNEALVLRVWETSSVLYEELVRRDDTDWQYEEQKRKQMIAARLLSAMGRYDEATALVLELIESQKYLGGGYFAELTPGEATFDGGPSLPNTLVGMLEQFYVSYPEFDGLIDSPYHGQIWDTFSMTFDEFLITGIEYVRQTLGEDDRRAIDTAAEALLKIREGLSALDEPYGFR